MHANLFKLLAMAAVVLTVQSAPAETPGDVEINAAEANEAHTDGVLIDEAVTDITQTEELPTVHLVRTLHQRDAPCAAPF